jgi:hypothetical protein
MWVPEPSQDGPGDGGDAGFEDMAQWSGDLMDGTVELRCDEDAADALWDNLAAPRYPVGIPTPLVGTEWTQVRTPLVGAQWSQGGTPLQPRQSVSAGAIPELPLTAPAALGQLRAGLIAEAAARSAQAAAATPSCQDALGAAPEAGGGGSGGVQGGASRRRVPGKRPKVNAAEGKGPDVSPEALRRTAAALEGLEAFRKLRRYYEKRNYWSVRWVKTRPQACFNKKANYAAKLSQAKDEYRKLSKEEVESHI